MKSDTPETDANTIHQMGQLRTAVVDVEFARRLERERDEALRLLNLTHKHDPQNAPRGWA